MLSKLIEDLYDVAENIEQHVDGQERLMRPEDYEVFMSEKSNLYEIANKLIEIESLISSLIGVRKA